MTNAWRAAELRNYIQYSNICAKVLRQALKADVRVDAAKRGESHGDRYEFVELNEDGAQFEKVLALNLNYS
ncbi:hypothetical protein DOY81_011089 [Sarcophaga bullata]|nr:hypothetical protein DOY81_011089 [Sarcophaga bullata]